MRIVKWVLIALGVLFVIGVIASIASPADETADSGATPSSESTPESDDAASATAEPAATAEPTPTPTADAGSFGDGTYTIGSDVQPGTYRGEGGTFCYWARLSGFGGEFEEIIANGTGDYSQVVTIEEGDVGFETEGCGDWTDDLAAITSSPSGPFGDGTYIVGTDLQPGTYGAPGGTLCYWSRLAAFTGEFGDIIANGTGDSNQVVTIAPGDVGFQTSDCGEWTAR